VAATLSWHLFHYLSEPYSWLNSHEDVNIVILIV